MGVAQGQVVSSLDSLLTTKYTVEESAENAYDRGGFKLGCI
jgi:hypothetical protein